LHFNTNTNNKGRGDLRPVCKAKEEKKKVEEKGGDPSGYKCTPNRCSNGHNLNSYKNLSRQQCASKCNSDSRCKGFEYGTGYSEDYEPRDCLLNDNIVTAGCDGAWHKLDFCVATNEEVKGVGEVCDKATIISTYTECKSAVETLGYKLGNNPWTGNYGAIPYGCSFRENGGKVDLHFNTNTNNKGRGDLRPVCKAKEGSAITAYVDEGVGSQNSALPGLNVEILLYFAFGFAAFGVGYYISRKS